MPPKPDKDRNEVSAHQRALNDPLLQAAMQEYADFPADGFISGRAAYLAHKQHEIMTGRSVEVVRRLGDMGMLVTFHDYGATIGTIEDAPHFHNGFRSGFPYFRTYALDHEGQLKLTHRTAASYSSAVRRLQRVADEKHS